MSLQSMVTGSIGVVGEPAPRHAEVDPRADRGHVRTLLPDTTEITVLEADRKA